jgi:hypothetical protein
VADWKFGRGVKVKAEGNYQWRFYAGAAMEMHPEMFEGRRVVGAIIQPAAEEPLTWEIIDTDELARFVAGMKMALADIAAGNTAFATGKWCRWCSGGPICPVKLSQAQELVGQHVDNTIDPAELGRLATLAGELEDWSKAVMALAHQELEKGRQVEGWKLVQKRATRQWVDDGAAAGALLGIGLDRSEIFETSIISPAAAEKVVKKKGGNPALLDEVIVARSSGTTLAPASDKRAAVTNRFDGSPLNLPMN